ncbi:hypothetical protein [Ruegeria arenilitoris]|uniref:hypothetical protein n=1 Tax=Ruegeria arenilitoris TaxID=1173585 RepID=UPI00147DECB8|nr:hypothetical protein [Ruegeria arenilitoris]
MKRSFRINSPDGSIRPTTVQSLDMLAFFADDEKSALQAIQMMTMEFHDYNVEQDAWELGGVAKMLMDSLNKRSAQVFVCGLVTLIMAHLNEDGSPASLNEASQITSQLAYDVNALQFKLLKSRGWEIKDKPIVGDAATIQRYFRKYRPAAHICAAKALIGAEGDNSHPMVQPLPKTLKTVSTVLFYQNLIKKWPGAENWNLWEVWHEGGHFEEAYPPEQPHEDFLHQIRQLKQS